jgi:hypothetical protein
MCILSPLFAANGVLRSVLRFSQTLISGFVAHSNDIPKPFVWIADTDKIIAAA